MSNSDEWIEYHIQQQRDYFRLIHDSGTWTGRESWRVKHWHALMWADIKRIMQITVIAITGGCVAKPNREARGQM